MEAHIKKELEAVSSSMFTKNFFGIFHGSISAKLEDNAFIINSKEAIFDKLKDDDFITLYCKKDYRWKSASIDADIHLKIYQNISEAKYITYTMPPFITAYTLRHDSIRPRDYFGDRIIGEIRVYDPKNFETWYPRASDEIYRNMLQTQNDMILIRGYGLYSYSRDLNLLIKKIAILENSCRLLYYSNSPENPRDFSLS